MQYNIFHNDFYDDMPGLPWAYRLTVFIGDPPQEILKLRQAVKEVQLPDMELMTFQVHFGGMNFHVPTRYRNTGSFTVKFYDDKNLSVYKQLLRIFRRTYDNREDKIEGTDGKKYAPKYSDFSQEVIFLVEILDPRVTKNVDTDVTFSKNAAGEEVISGTQNFDADVVAQYYFKDCFAEKLDEVEFDYSSEECVEWGTTIIFNDITNEYAGKNKIKLNSLDQEPKQSDLQLPNSKGPDSTSEWKKEKAKDRKELTEKVFDDKAAVDFAHKVLDEEKRKAKEERETAMEKARKEADDTGRLKNGDYVTAKERWTAESTAAEQTLREETQMMLEANDYYEIRDKYGIDLVNDSEETIKQKVNDIRTRDALNGKFNLNPTMEYDLIDRKKTIESEAKSMEQEVMMRYDITNRDVGAVEMNDTQSTDQWYDERKDGKKAQHMDERAAKIQSAQKIIREQEEVQKEIKSQKLLDARKYKMGGYTGDKDLARKTFIENQDYYDRLLNESRQRIETETAKLKALTEDK